MLINSAPEELHHRRAIAIPGPVRAANRGTSSKQPRFIRHRRRFGCFPRRRQAVLMVFGLNFFIRSAGGIPQDASCLILPRKRFPFFLLLCYNFFTMYLKLRKLLWN